MILGKDYLKRQEERTNREESLHQELKNFHYRSVLNIIFVVATGTFVLSISFIGVIKDVLIWPEALITSWCFLVVAIASRATSSWVGHEIASQSQDLLDKYRASHFTYPEENWDMDMIKNSKIARLHSVRAVVDLGSIFTLCVGLACLIAFASINLLTQNDLREKIRQDTKTILPVSLEENI